MSAHRVWKMVNHRWPLASVLCLLSAMIPLSGCGDSGADDALDSGAKLDSVQHDPQPAHQPTAPNNAVPNDSEIDPELARRFWKAVFFGKQDEARRLAAKHPELIDAPILNRRPVLVDACVNHQPQAVRLMLELGADVNVRGFFGETPLLCAAQHDDIALLQILLNAGADINAIDGQHRSALDYAKHREVRQFLIDHGAPPDG